MIEDNDVNVKRHDKSKTRDLKLSRARKRE